MISGFGAGFLATLLGGLVGYALILAWSAKKQGISRTHVGPPRNIVAVLGASAGAAGLLVWLVLQGVNNPLDAGIARLLRPLTTNLPPLVRGGMLLPSWTGLLAAVAIAAIFAAPRGMARARLVAAGPLLLLLQVLVQGNIRRPTPLAPSAYTFFPGAPDATAMVLSGLAVAWWIAWTRGELGDSHRLPRRLPAAIAIIASGMVLLGGGAWPTSLLLGAILGVGWTLLASVLLDWTAAVAPQFKAPHIPYVWTILLIAGVGLRIATYWTQGLGPDGQIYAVMGHALLEGGSFTMPWGGIYDGLGTADASPSQHYPPAYPTMLAGAFAVAGFGPGAVHVVAIATGLASIVVVYACTRDLYGSPAATTLSALVAIGPFFIRNTGNGYSENLILLLFAATMWAILKSLDKPAYIVPAGILAGLGYLSKSSIGYFFVIAGLGGLAWRLRFRGWRVLRDPYYVAAIISFGAIVVGWASRNILVHGTWQTSKHLTAAYETALSSPLDWTLRALFVAAYFAAAGYGIVLAVLPWLKHLGNIPLLDDEHDSGLWLAALLPLVLTVLIESAIWMHEGQFVLDSVRYLLFVMVPIGWLLARHLHCKDQLRQRGKMPGGGSTALALTASILLLAVGAIVYTLPTPATPDEQVGETLQSHLQPGDSLAFVGDWGIYQYYLAATDWNRRPLEVSVHRDGPPVGLATDWALVLGAEVPGVNYEPAAAIGSGDAPWATLWQAI